MPTVYPCVPGHEIVGRVTKIGSAVTKFKVGDLAAFPPNDLASSQLAFQLLDLGAFRADVSGAGPAVYGLFRDNAAAKSAAGALEPLGRTWVTRPSW